MFILWLAAAVVVVALPVLIAHAWLENGLARLRAAELSVQVARVRALADEWSDPAGRGPVLTKRDCAAALRAALDDIAR